MYKRQLKGDWLDQVNLVTARALAPLNELIGMSVDFGKNNAEMLFPKGLNVDIELTEATKYWNIQYKILPSRTHANGCLLRIKGVKRVKNY